MRQRSEYSCTPITCHTIPFDDVIFLPFIRLIFKYEYNTYWKTDEYGIFECYNSKYYFKIIFKMVNIHMA